MLEHHLVVSTVNFLFQLIPNMLSSECILVCQFLKHLLCQKQLIVPCQASFLPVVPFFNITGKFSFFILFNILLFIFSACIYDCRMHMFMYFMLVFNLRAVPYSNKTKSLIKRQFCVGISPG